MGKLIRLAPLRGVSNVRYYIGLAMFFLPFLAASLGQHIAQRVPPDTIDGHVAVGLLGDTVFLAGLFVLGSDFWGQSQGAVHPWGEGPAAMNHSILCPNCRSH